MLLREGHSVCSLFCRITLRWPTVATQVHVWGGCARPIGQTGTCKVEFDFSNVQLQGSRYDCIGYSCHRTFPKAPRLH